MTELPDKRTACEISHAICTPAKVASSTRSGPFFCRCWAESRNIFEFRQLALKRINRASLAKIEIKS